MSNPKAYRAPSRAKPESHQRGQTKLARIPVKVQPSEQPARKPAWIRAKAPTGAGVTRIKRILRERKLSSVCEEAACPNLGECFNHGTATFMILGDICTRRCPFCDVAHGRPYPIDPTEAAHLGESIARMGRLSSVKSASSAPVCASTTRVPPSTAPDAIQPSPTMTRLMPNPCLTSGKGTPPARS